MNASALQLTPDNKLSASYQERLSPEDCRSQRIFTKAEIALLAVILAFGIFQFTFYQRSTDFIYDDVAYAQFADSMLHHGYYGVQGRPETNQPPGLPAILLLISLIFGSSHAIFLRTMAVFDTLAFFLTYFLLRREGPRWTAAAVCLILISSPILFIVSTQVVYPALPYLAATTAALLAARGVEHSNRRRLRLAWRIILAFLVASSIMLASAGIALVAAMLARSVVGYFQSRDIGWMRIKMFAPALILGCAVQGAWIHRQPAPLEWQLPGYPASYLEQLKVKLGNYPELGMATVGDIPLRIAHNLVDYSAWLAKFFYPLWINVSVVSVFVASPLLLVALGWGYRLWMRRGQLLDWYFAGYVAIYLLWPWKLEERFFLPVAPLACFYIWCGIEAIAKSYVLRPRRTGALAFVTVVPFSLGATHWALHSPAGRAGQATMSAVIWSSIALLALWLALKKCSFARWTSVSARLGMKAFTPPAPRLRWRTAACLVVLVPAAIGVVRQIRLAQENAAFDLSQQTAQYDIEAALWLRAHSEQDAIIMARHVPIAYHYSARKVVWFPPLSNAAALKEGIDKHKVRYVVVVRNRFKSYYFPPDDRCFEPLLLAHPEAFRVAYETPHLRIFQVVQSVGHS